MHEFVHADHIFELVTSPLLRICRQHEEVGFFSGLDLRGQLENLLPRMEAGAETYRRIHQHLHHQPGVFCLEKGG